MGYSKAKSAVTRAEELLKRIVLMPEGAKLEIPSSTPAQLAYALRDAFNAAEFHKKTFPAYADFKVRYRIKQNHNSVVIEPREQSVIDFGDPITHLGKSSTITVEEATSFLEVVGAAIKHKAPKLVYPNADLDDAGIDRIKLWCSKNNYTVSNYNPLTLEKCLASTLPATPGTITLLPSGTES